MLSILTKRLCPLMTLALAFGCGKKINDPKTSTGGGTSQGQTTELPATLTLQIDETVSPVKTYEMKKNAWFNLPVKLGARDASAIGKQVKIYYNLLTNGDYEFQCTYKSTSSATELAFVRCASVDGVEIISNSTDLSNMDFPMDAGTSLKMQLTNPSATGIKINAVFQVDWK